MTLLLTIKGDLKALTNEDLFFLMDFFKRGGFTAFELKENKLYGVK